MLNLLIGFPAPNNLKTNKKDENDSKVVAGENFNGCLT